MRYKLVILVLLLALAQYVRTHDFITGASVSEGPLIENNDGSIDVHFCPDCTQIFADAISSAKDSLHCALFDLDHPDIISIMDNKSRYIDVKVVVDNENPLDKSYTRQDTSSQYSHNKFCVIDGSRVLTGSTNPTLNGLTYNHNNLLIIPSTNIARSYEDEFKELWVGEFGSGKRVKDPTVILNNISVSTYFCPEDWCESKILNELGKADESVRFMEFSFTSTILSGKLIELHSKNITIEGVMDKRQNSGYSQYDELLDSGIDVRWHASGGKMHNKVFIIDNKTVITGSMNPTKSGDSRNDENIVIIHDENITKEYLEEFSRLFEAIEPSG